jgi:hypothetical protein
MHQHQHAPLTLDLLEAVPQPMMVFLEVLLEKDPGQRFQNPAEVLKAISTVAAAIDEERRITRQSLRKTPSAASRVGTREPPTRLEPKKISVARLPVTGSDVFGREEDIAFLDDAWANQDVNVISIVAWAGAGKSTLVNHWLRGMATDHYRSADLIFGWSFYRKGSSGAAGQRHPLLPRHKECKALLLIIQLSRQDHSRRGRKFNKFLRHLRSRIIRRRQYSEIQRNTQTVLPLFFFAVWQVLRVSARQRLRP